MKELPTLESAINFLDEFLAKNHCRKTPERYAILEHINLVEGHFTAEKLYEMMQSNFRVSLASVYNNLELLLRAGLLIKFQNSSKSAEYERTFNNQVHHHLICSNCGVVKEFTDRNLKTYIGNKKFKYFTPTHFSVNIYGYCNRCRILLNGIITDTKKTPKSSVKKQANK